MIEQMLDVLVLAPRGLMIGMDLHRWNTMTTLPMSEALRLQGYGLVRVLRQTAPQPDEQAADSSA